MKKIRLYQGYWDIKCVDENNKVLWEVINKSNSLVDGGEHLMLTTFYRNTDQPSEFYIRLCNDYLLDNDGLVNIQNEPIGDGYSPQLLERSTVGFPTIELHDGDFKVTSKQVSFGAVGGSIGPINTVFIATSADNSGTLIAFVTLGDTYTVQSGNNLLVTMSAKQK